MSLEISLSLTGACCESVRVVEQSPNGLLRDLIKVTSSHFADATNWNGANSEGVIIKPAYSFKIVDNNVNRFLDEGTEWQRTLLGVEFLIDGFDSTVNDYTFYIHINQI